MQIKKSIFAQVTMMANLELLNHCMICPRECGINRNAGQKGYCGRGAGYEIASICLHSGEEPVISGVNGICNIFFAGCNMRCLYCQNYQISRITSPYDQNFTLGNVLSYVKEYLDSGVEGVGFVSPSHFTPHVKEIIYSLHESGYKPVYVYNTNSYDKTDVIKSLEGLIDVYLPDLKYSEPETSRTWSDAPLYPEIAKATVAEMYRQKGSTVVLNENGQAVTGLIIRHLVLPGKVHESIKILEWIAEELSPSVHISLMSQYYPTKQVSKHPILGRSISQKEYTAVVEALEDLGFYKGWVQDFGSSSIYHPDFQKKNPFGRI